MYFSDVVMILHFFVEFLPCLGACHSQDRQFGRDEDGSKPRQRVTE